MFILLSLKPLIQKLYPKLPLAVEQTVSYCFLVNEGDPIYTYQLSKGFVLCMSSP